MTERQTPTLEELQQEIIRDAGREAFVAGYLGGMIPRYNSLTSSRVHTAFYRGARLAQRHQRNLYWLNAVLTAYHREHATFQLERDHKAKVVADYSRIKKFDIKIARKYQQTRQPWSQAGYWSKITS